MWTEIYSVIKGGMRASESYLGYLQLHEYMTRHAGEYLTGGEKRTIYYVFLSYEKWKKKVGAYDFMDVVQHVWARKHEGWGW